MKTQSQLREVGSNFSNWQKTSDRLTRIDPVDGSTWRWIKGRRTRNGSRINVIELISESRNPLDQFCNETLICELARRTNSSASAIIERNRGFSQKLNL